MAALVIAVRSLLAAELCLQACGDIKPARRAAVKSKAVGIQTAVLLGVPKLHAQYRILYEHICAIRHHLTHSLIIEHFFSSNQTNLLPSGKQIRDRVINKVFKIRLDRSHNVLHNYFKTKSGYGKKRAPARHRHLF